MTPAMQALVTVAQGYDAFRHRAVEPTAMTGAEQLYQGLPLLTLLDRFRHSRRERTFPLSREQALLQLLDGSSAPKPANLWKLNQAARRERRPPR